MLFSTGGLFIILLLNLPTSSAKSLVCKTSQPERECGNNISQLWLDIVFVVDVSLGMTDAGLKSLQSDMTTIFLSRQHFGIDSKNNYTTRLGLVVYSENAEQVFDLNKVTSMEELRNELSNGLRATQSKDANLELGLGAASKLFEEGKTAGRKHYKQLVVVYASSYISKGTHDAQPIADQLKYSGVSIVTISLGEDDDENLKQLADIASPHFNFTQGLTIAQMRNTLLEMNCYCPKKWFQLRDPITHKRLGVCIRPFEAVANWWSAQYVCRKIRPGSHLVHVYSQQKHELIQEKLGKVFAPDVDQSYFIGLKFENSHLVWDQMINETQYELFPDPMPWDDTYPNRQYSQFPMVVAKQITAEPRVFKWRNVDDDQSFRYVCEMPSCDSTNYCQADEI